MAKFVLLALFVLLLGIVGMLDYDAEQIEEQTYCEMVKAKTWPDYKGIYFKTCISNAHTGR